MNFWANYGTCNKFQQYNGPEIQINILLLSKEDAYLCLGQSCRLNCWSYHCWSTIQRRYRLNACYLKNVLTIPIFSCLFVILGDCIFCSWLLLCQRHKTHTIAKIHTKWSADQPPIEDETQGYLNCEVTFISSHALRRNTEINPE